MISSGRHRGIRCHRRGCQCHGHGHGHGARSGRPRGRFSVGSRGLRPAAAADGGWRAGRDRPGCRAAPVCARCTGSEGNNLTLFKLNRPMIMIRVRYHRVTPESPRRVMISAAASRRVRVTVRGTGFRPGRRAGLPVGRGPPAAWAARSRGVPSQPLSLCQRPAAASA